MWGYVVGYVKTSGSSTGAVAELAVMHEAVKASWILATSSCQSLLNLWNL